MYKVSKLAPEKDLPNSIGLPHAEMYAVKTLAKRDLKSTRNAMIVLGQLISIDGSDATTVRLVTEHKFLDELHWILLRAAIKERTDCLWVLANIATSEVGAELIMSSRPDICINVMLEIKKNSLKMKQESLFFFCNLIHKMKDKREYIERLCNHNLLGIIHDELTSGLADGAALVWGLEILTMVFDALPQ